MCFYLAHFRLSRLAKESAGTQGGLFFLHFLLPAIFLSLSLALFLTLLSVSPPLSCRYFMHGLTQSHVDYTTHWHQSSHWGTEKKKINTCMHPLRRSCHLAQFLRRHRRRFIDLDKAVGIQAPLPYTDMFFKWRKDPVFNPNTVPIVPHSHCWFYVLNGIPSGWFLAWESQLHNYHNTPATSIVLSILQGLLKKMPHFPWEVWFLLE